MIAGHFGLAAGVKAAEREAPLWALMLGTAWLDVIFVPLFLADVEHLVPIPGSRPGAYGEAIIHADYTHSLVGAVLLSILFGVVLAIRYGTRSGAILALVAMSHWILDLPVHRGDMAILLGAAGNLPRLGFGLWRYPLLAAALELGIVLVGGLMYWRAARGVAGDDGPMRRRANLCGASVLAAGVLTLVLNVLGA